MCKWSLFISMMHAATDEGEITIPQMCLLYGELFSVYSYTKTMTWENFLFTLVGYLT